MIIVPDWYIVALMIIEAAAVEAMWLIICNNANKSENSFCEILLNGLPKHLH